jgi:phage terminase small subunit
MMATASIEKPLSPKARLFAERLGWSQDFNATQIAIGVGYSPRSARKTASDLLADPRVKAIVDGIMAQRLAESRIRPDRVLEELAAIAFSSIDDYEIAKADQPNAGHVIEKPAAPGAMRAVKEVTIKQWINSKFSLVTQTKIKLHDKSGALSNAMKHLGLLKEEKVRHEHTGKDGAPIEHTHSITVRFVKPNAPNESSGGGDDGGR